MDFELAGLQYGIGDVSHSTEWVVTYQYLQSISLRFTIHVSDHNVWHVNALNDAISDATRKSSFFFVGEIYVRQLRWQGCGHVKEGQNDTT